MSQIDPRDAEAISSAAVAFARLVEAVRFVDHPAISARIAELLAAATRLARTGREKDDEALARAVARLP